MSLPWIVVIAAVCLVAGWAAWELALARKGGGQ